MKTLILIGLLISSSLVAQMSLKPGRSVDLKNEEQIHVLQGELNKRLLATVINQKNQVSRLISISTDGGVLSELDVADCFPEEIDVMVGQTKVYVFTRTLKNGVLTLNQLILDENLKEEKNVELLSHKIDSDIHKGGFKIEGSPLNDSYAILQEVPGDLGGSEALLVHMYDYDFNFLWKSSIDTKLKQTNNPTNRLVISRETGVAHVVKRHRKGADFKYYVYHFFKNKPAVGHQIDLRGPRITELNMACDISGNLLVSGFYTQTTYDASVGYFHRIYSIDGHVKTKIQRPFKPEFMERFIGKKAHKKGASLQHLEISSIVSAWGSFLVVYENQQTETEKKTGKQLNINGPLVVRVIDGKGDFVKDIDLPVIHRTDSDQNYFSSFYTYDLYGGAKDEASILYNEISEMTKDSKFEVPFKSSNILNVHGNADHKIEKLQMDQLSNDGAMLVSTNLCHKNRGRWYFLLTNKERSKITPAIVVYGK